MSSKRSFVVSVWVALFLLAGVGLGQKRGQPEVVESNYSYQETVQKLKDAIVGNQMMLLLEADHKMMLSMIKAESPPSITILFARPQMGEMLAKAEPKAALEMPMRVLVREFDDGKVRVVYYKPSYLFSHYQNKNLDMVGKNMDMMVEKLVTAATR